MTDWPVKTLGEVCGLVNGATPDTKITDYWGGPHAWITPAEMGGLNSPFLAASRRTLSDKGLASCSATLVAPNTVILSSRAPIGHLVINEVPMATNQGCKSLIPRTGLNFKFLYFYLKANVELLNSLGTGTTFKELSGTQLKTVEIPVPPLEEQKRIVSLLDAATERVTELTACYEQARIHANNLFTSALSDEIQGNPDWPVKTLSELFDTRPKSADSVKQKEYLSTGIFPVVDQGKELVGGFTDNDYLVRDFGSPVIVFGDHTRCVKYVDFPFATGADGTKVLVPRQGVNPKYAYFQLLSINLPSKGYARHFGELSKLSFVLPPLEEQKRIVARLDAMRAKTSEMIGAYDAKLQAAKNLRQSILEAAFAGEL
jgi:type I restriction enzyme S subunit